MESIPSNHSSAAELAAPEMSRDRGRNDCSVLEVDTVMAKARHAALVRPFREGATNIEAMVIVVLLAGAALVIYFVTKPNRPIAPETTASVSERQPSQPAPKPSAPVTTPEPASTPPQTNKEVAGTQPTVTGKDGSLIPWEAVGAIAGVGSLVIAVVALVRKRD